MNRLERTLCALFWLPILLGGIVGFAFVEPRLQKFGIVSAGMLAIFIAVVLWQVVYERRATARLCAKGSATAQEAARTLHD